MKQTIDVDDLECPCGGANHRRTSLRGRTDALSRNLIVVPRVGFTIAMVWRSRSPISSCTTRSRAGKLEAAQHHNRVVKREEETDEERYFLMSYSGDPPSLL
jgi:hypothetical protein